MAGRGVGASADGGVGGAGGAGGLGMPADASREPVPCPRRWKALRGGLSHPPPAAPALPRIPDGLDTASPRRNRRSGESRDLLPRPAPPRGPRVKDREANSMSDLTYRKT